MKEREDHGERIHRRVWELLPWYVNGSLGEREREQVEAHLAGCPACEAEARECRRTAESLSNAGEVAPSPHPAQLRRLFDRIDEEERNRPGRLAVFSAAPRPLRLALAAQAAAILLLAGALVWSLRSPAPAAPPSNYVTLADPTAAPAPAARLRVMFSPATTEREMREILIGVRGGIVAGPSPLGAYTVEIPTNGDPVGAVLARLRTEPRVVFAEPAAGEPGRK